MLGVGALISISGSDESGTLGTARVAYAMAGDGVFPRVFGRVHPKYKTPHLSLFIQGASAFVVSLLGSLDALISTSVFFMSLVYLATCTSLLTLRRRAKERAVKLRGGPLLPLAGIVSSLFLASQIAATNVLLGFVILLMGVPIYTKYTPKSEVEQIIKFVEDRQTIGKRIYVTEDVFLAHLLKHLRKVRRSTIAA